MAWPAALYTPGCVAAYPYYDDQNRLLTVIGRYEHPHPVKPGQIEKTLVPYTVWQQPDGRLVWVSKGLLGLRPLYNLGELSKHPGSLVILSEGEKCANAVKACLPAVASLSWMGGTNAIAKTDFTPLAGRNVVIFPDNDATGQRAAEQLVEVMGKIGAARVRMLDIAALCECVQGEAPKGHDIADLIARGLTGEALVAHMNERPALLRAIDLTVPEDEAVDEVTPANAKILAAAAVSGRASDEPMEDIAEDIHLPRDFFMTDQGIYKRDTDARGREITTYAGSSVYVVGRTRRGSDGKGWGYYVRFRTPTGAWDTAVIPAHKLAGDGREVRAALLDLGVTCPPDRQGRTAQLENIAYSMRHVTEVITVSEYPGWVGDDAFALPNTILMAPGVEKHVLLDMEEGRPHEFATSGTLHGWQAMVGGLENNSRAALAIAMSFTGCLMRPLGIEGGGIHFWGRTSMSKTSIATAAGATWGGGAPDGFVNSWRATDNGLEGLAAIHNDTFFILDELALVNPDRLIEILYMLGNGHGKARATKTGGAQPIANWKSMTLSTGEITTAAHMKAGNAGRRGAQVRVPGGVEARMIDLQIAFSPDPRRSFEDLGPFENEASLADHIKSEAKRHYGHAGPAFVAAFLADRAAHVAVAKAEIARFADEVSEPGDEAALGRVATRFGLIAAAGEMAIRFGILPWREGAARTAALTCYHAWKEGRGDGTLSHDERDALSALKRFFELHGSSRFEPLNPDQIDETEPAERLDDRIVPDRCGYRKHDPEQGMTYYVTPEAWRSEVCTTDRDPDLVARVALDCGALIPGENNRLLKKARVPGYPHPKRVYVIRPDLLP